MTGGCADPWFKAEITSPVDSYNPSDSSFPGLPMEIVYDIDGPTPGVTSITYITNKGSFVTLEDTLVINLGQIAELKGKKIYWVPVEESGEMVDGARIKAIISYIDKIVIVSKTFSARIIKDQNGAYSFR
jgi:hypothetical protein